MSGPDEPDNFAQWVTRISDPDGRKLNWKGRKTTQCVITVATGYPAGLLQPLVASLREHSDARIIIAASADSGIEDNFANQNCLVYPVAENEGYRPYPALARLEYYLEIIKGLPAYVDQLLLVDSRDVVFQADPFADFPQQDLTFFAENDDTASWNLRTTNGRWAWLMLPGGLPQSLKGNPIVNGGVIAGTPAGIERMCRAKLNIALTTHEWTKHTTGLDNISTNLIAHSNMAGPCTVVPNHQFVTNVYRATDMMIDKDGKMRARGNRPCPIVHMYDRQSELLSHVNSRYDVPVDANLTVSQDRSIGKSRPFAGFLHYLNLVRMYLADPA